MSLSPMHELSQPRLKFDVSAAVKTHVAVFRVMTQYNLVDECQHMGGTFCLHLLTCWQTQYIPIKRWYNLPDYTVS
jgi:hypothetical protein